MVKIEVRNFTKDYGHGRGVFDISFEIREGEIYGFLGPNGSGKSTTIRHLMGFSKPDKGYTAVLGLESFSNYHKFMDRVGYIPGEISLPEGLNGFEFLDMMKKLKNVKDDRRVKTLCDVFELDPSGDTRRVSFGTKRKLAIVAALMNDPEILILDEPTSGLDFAVQQAFIQFIKEEKRRGKTVLFSSHIFGEVDATCDRIAIIKEGKIVSEFLAKDLKHKDNKNYLIEFGSDGDLRRFLEKGSDKYIIVDKAQRSATVNIDDKNINFLIRELAEFKVSGFSHLSETLEDHFMKYYKDDRQFGGAV